MRQFGWVKGLYGPDELRSHNGNGKTNMLRLMDPDAKTTWLT